MFPARIDLNITDQINNRIWSHLHKLNQDALSKFPSHKYDLKAIRDEIEAGCSPCPDILTNNFGQKPSVLFISTVYGSIFPYLQQVYDRNVNEYGLFAKDFYNRIISRGVGIYKRLFDLYQIINRDSEIPYEFGFSELIKTVLYNANGKVSGLDSGNEFLDYMLRYEVQNLRDRINSIKDECYVFTFTEDCTFIVLSLISGIEDPTSILDQVPSNLELKTNSYKLQDVVFRSERKRNGSPRFTLSTRNGSFSETVAFNTVFHAPGKEHIHIIPLPHPSSANNKYWSITNLKILSKLLHDDIF